MAQQDAWQVADLRTNGTAAPMLVPLDRPVTFRWVVRSERRDARQTQSRVVIENATAMIWDSGVREGPATSIDYAGPALRPATSYAWRVEATDDRGNVARTAASFETALDDWGDAIWIAPDQDTEPAPLLRRDVRVNGEPTRARLYVAGLGLHRCTINGVRVTDAELESGTTDYDHTVLYSGYDVTDLVSTGSSTLGVELGRGFYAMTTPNTWRWHEAPWRGPRKLLLRLEITLADGTVQVVSSDPDWRWSEGPTRFDSFYEGESYDGGHDPDGWDRPGFDGSGWRAAVTSSAPRGALVPRTHDPVRVVRTLQPVAWHQVGERSFVADLGDTIAGRARIDTVGLPAGTRLQVTYGEQRTESGAVEAENRHVFTDRFQRDEVVVGDRPVPWESRFTYAGFRYVQVDGAETPVALTGRVLHNDVSEVSRFACSDEVLTWIDGAMRCTVANNLHHLPTDTPMFEKNGWTGDAQVAVESMLGAYDLHGLLGKWLDDLADSQELPETGPRSPDGEVRPGRLPVVVPSPGWGYIELAPSPEWTTVYPFVLDRLYRWYADEGLVRRHLGPVLRYLDHEIGRLDDDGLSTGALGDYLAPGFRGVGKDDLRIAASCYLYRALVLTADLINRAGDERWSARRSGLLAVAARLKDAVNATFLDPDQGLYRSDREVEYRQTSNLLPVAMGITPPELVQSVVDHLAEDVRAHDSHHNVGCLGISQLLRVLSDHGHADLAVTVATQTTPPSWGAWMAAGETTLREMWNDWSRSHDHYFMGTAAQWLYEYVAGVRMLEPGWAAFAVDPVARVGLEHASYTVQTVRGELGAAWRRNGEALQLEVTVPVGARARVHLPGEEPRWLGSGHWQFGR